MYWVGNTWLLGTYGVEACLDAYYRAYGWNYIQGATTTQALCCR